MVSTVAAFMISLDICNTPLQCLQWQSYGAIFDIFFITCHLIPLKFVFVGIHINSGFRVINTALKDLADRESPLGPTALAHLMTLQDDLAHLFTSLTEVMFGELVAIMAYGTVATVCMWLIPIVKAADFNGAAYGPMMCLYITGAGVTVFLPCEFVHRLLAALGRTRDLLLVTERHHPQLSPQLGLFRETVGRDLGRLGDLGLFRIQRSTILSISATILTYIIIVIQFIQA